MSMPRDLSQLDRRTLIAGAAAALGGLLPLPALAAPFASRRIAVTVRGQGPDVILIPGLASGPGIWNGAVAASPGYRYHLVQVRGFAGLPADLNRSGPLIGPLTAEIARYIATGGVRRPAIVGHSMGGTLAMMLGLQGVAGRIMVVDMLPDGAGMVGGTAGGVGYLAGQLSQWFTGTKAGRQMLADMLASTPGAQGSDPDVIANALGELAQTDLGPRLPSLRIPLQVVYAQPADAELRKTATQRFQAAYAHLRMAQLLPIGPSGHVIMEDQPARFAAALRNFLRSG
ncbi:alpha/beta hydrolase [Sphingobium aquiterrae]|uniref:alpha/beta fold hydrolase n=1 Tax=Sphingobium aquiterrae TaxID=2038656 RepID=UPI00301933F0